MLPDDLATQLRLWRRDFHQYPELGYLEMRTASTVASILHGLGFELQLGKEVMSEENCMGKPSEEETKEHLEWALANGAKERFIKPLSEGYTGIVAKMDFNQGGPTIAYRFDMDALPIQESKELDHFPNEEGFQSKVPNHMHACGHDSHMAIGLGLASWIPQNKRHLQGTIKLIFQPAEEGTRGAKSMVEAGVVNDVDYFIASHIGTGVPHNHFVAGNNGFLATSKLNISFHGVASHAGSHPEAGRNALLAAATATLNMHAIARHADGASRINVGELHAGSGRNVIANHARLIVETRGNTSKINKYMKNQVTAIVAGAAEMYQLQYKIETVGEALNCHCSRDLATILNTCAVNHPAIINSQLESNDSAGSEDATYFMERVQKNGGLATYCIFGTDLAAGHHHERFDINEASMLTAVEILSQSINDIILMHSS